MSYEYLLGDTESKKHENMAIVDDLGLSEQAVEQIKAYKRTPKTIESLSKFITDSYFNEFIERIVYLMDCYAMGAEMRKKSEKRCEFTDKEGREHYVRENDISYQEYLLKRDLTRVMDSMKDYYENKDENVDKHN